MRRRQHMSDKVAVITGAAGGIGAETARLLARQGCALVIADINESGLVKICRELELISPRVMAVVLDVTQSDSWRELLERAKEAYHHVDILINCAGMVDPGPIEKLDEQRLRRLVDVNFVGTMLGARTFLPYFREEKSGHLIFIASLGGVAPMPGEAVYSATKFAVRGFCLSLALELQRSPVNISVVCPDSVETAQLREEAIHQGSPMSFIGSPLKPSDVAEAIFKAVNHPRIEIDVSYRRGVMARLLAFCPRALAAVYPLLDSLGRRGLAKYISASTQHSTRSGLTGGEHA